MTTDPDDPRDEAGYYQEEQPVGRRDDVLFPFTQGLVGRLHRVGDTIAAAAGSPAPSRGVTFLLSGEWGTGKSSALRYLEDYVREQVADTDVVFVPYRAPQHETRPGGARAGLLLEVVLALSTAIRRSAAPGLTTDLTEFMRAALGDDGPSGRGLPDPEHDDAVTRLGTERRLAVALGDSLADGLVLERWLHHYIELTRGPRVTTVVLIDDLDRCRSSEFITDLLVATGYWAHQPNHFFVIAADERQVRSALAKHIVAAPDPGQDGLDKYVHVTVRLPPAIPTRPAAAELMRRYLFTTHLSPDLQKMLTGQLDRGEKQGLLEPLLDTCTPRTFKDRFNGLVSALGGSQEFSPQTIQRAVIEIRWPGDYRRHVEPAVLGDNAQLAWCRHLVSLATETLRRTPNAEPEAWAAGLVEIAGRSGLLLGDTDPHLAFYLAANPPTWLAESPDRLSDSGPEIPKAADLIVEPGRARGTDDLSFRVSELEAIADVGIPERMQAAYDALVPRLVALESFPESFAIPLGNAALQFGKYDLLNAALRLHMWAKQADPTHVNIAQNLVEFVLDEAVVDLYERAEKWLSEIAATGVPGTDRRPHRTPLYALRLAIAMKRPIDPATYDELVTAAIAPDSPWTTGHLFDLLNTVDGVRRFEYAEPIAEAALLKMNGEDAPINRSLRMRLLGTVAARSYDPDHERYAGEIYLLLLWSGRARKFSTIGHRDLLLNLSLLAKRHNAHALSAYLVWCAARLDEQDEATRLRLVRAYSAEGDEETARTMIEGTVSIPTYPPASPPFPQPPLPRSPAGVAFFDRFLPEETYLERLYPEIWSTE